MDTTHRRTRREWLAACAGTASVAGLAGCLGSGSDDGDGNGDGDDGAGDGDDGSEQPSTWPTVDADARNTGHNPGASGPTGDVEAIWTFDTGRDPTPGFSATPAVADGTAYVGTLDDTFYAIDASDGSEEWQADLQSRVTGVCAVDDDVVYVPAFEHVFALDRSDGSTVWTHEIGEHAADAPTLYEGSLYWIGSPNSTGAGTVPFERLDLSDDPERTTLTTFDHGENTAGVPNSTPAISDGRAYVGASDRVVAIDLESGETDWTYQAEEPVRMDVGQIAVADGTVYAPSLDDSGDVAELAGVHAIDAESGAGQWRLTEGFSGQSQGASYADGTVFVGGDAIHALDADDGTRRWEAPGQTVPSIADGVVYAFGPDGLRGVDADSGDVVLQRDLPVRRTAYRQQVAVVEGTLVYKVGPTGVIEAVSSA